MSLTTLAFFTGLFGSLHCVAMCGPLVMAMPFQNKHIFPLLLQRLLYQVGRICVYSMMGLLAGLAGSRFNILGLQEGLSLVTGSILVLAGLIHLFGKQNKKLNGMQSTFVMPLTKLMGNGLSKPYGGLLAGALNGFLPCGMVYVALAASLNAGTALQGSQFMLFFGLGTTPLMLMASFAPLFFRKRLRIPRLIPYLFLVSGFLLIYKGANAFAKPGTAANTVEDCR